MSKPSPAELWAQALDEHTGHHDEAMRDRYRELMIEHGHLVPREPGDDGNLPCGWPGVAASLPAEDETEDGPHDCWPGFDR